MPGGDILWCVKYVGMKKRSTSVRPVASHTRINLGLRNAKIIVLYITLVPSRLLVMEFKQGITGHNSPIFWYKTLNVVIYK